MSAPSYIRGVPVTRARLSHNLVGRPPGRLDRRRRAGV